MWLFEGNAREWEEGLYCDTKYKLIINYKVLYFTNCITQAVSCDGRQRSARRSAVAPLIAFQAFQIKIL